MKRSVFAILILTILLNTSCGPVVFTSKIGIPPPHWYYPDKVETVRYVYFPDFEIYYDFSSSKYLYYNDEDWINAAVLPQRFYGIDLKRSKQIRITNYFGDNIKKYHCETIIKRRNSHPKRYH